MVDRRIFRENAEYDHGHGDPSRLRKFVGRRGDDFGDKGTGNLKQRKTSARFGDNPLKDVTLNELDGDSVLNKLQSILTQADVGENEIRAGIDLSPAGRHKVAAQLGIAADDVPVYIASLRTKLGSDGDDLVESYRRIVEDEDKKFTWEQDSGGVTIRDNVAGTQAYVQGSEGFALVNKLRSHAVNDQMLLSQYRNLMETVEADQDMESLFAEEIEGKSGSFNFPWKVEGQSGTGTVAFVGGSKGEPKLKLLSVRDAEGDQIHPDGDMHDAVLRQAHEFIAEA